MTDTPIEPALTSEEWAALEGRAKMPIAEAGDHAQYYPESIPYLIAIANADPRNRSPAKITREMVDTLRDIAVLNLKRRTKLDRLAAPALMSVAAALESYLPPE